MVTRDLPRDEHCFRICGRLLKSTAASRSACSAEMTCLRHRYRLPAGNGVRLQRGSARTNTRMHFQKSAGVDSVCEAVRSTRTRRHGGVCTREPRGALSFSDTRRPRLFFVMEGPRESPSKRARGSDEAAADADAAVLYSYWRSSCSWRVRIAMNLKRVAYKYHAVHLVRGGARGCRRRRRRVTSAGGRVRGCPAPRRWRAVRGRVREAERDEGGADARH